MAAIVASGVDVHCAAEEALLDAYDLQWKAIDIRLEKLRNECERMILEYEVEVKQQMYLQECEDLMKQRQTQHEKQQSEMERELKAKDRKVEAAEEEARRLRQRSVQPTAVEKTQAEAKSKKEKAVKRKPVVEEESEEAIVQTKAKKAVVSKKPAIEKPVPRPVSPPVYSPEEDDTTDVVPEPEPPVEEADLSQVADDDLLQMLSQDQDYESEDFGDSATMSLIHPKSPAMLSPKRLKKKAAFEAAALAKTAASPLRGGTASLADRIMNRIKTVAKQPLGDSSSEASNSPLPAVAVTPTKRALKRRKTAVLSSISNAPAVGTQSNAAERPTRNNEEKQTEPAPLQLKSQEAKKAPKKTKKSPVPALPNSRDSPDEVEPEAESEPHVTSKASKKQDRNIGAVTGRSKARQTAKLAALRAASVEEDDVAGFSSIHDIKTPKVPRKKMGVDGKKKQINDLAAKRAEFQQSLSESILAEEESEQPTATKKRRRPDETVKRKEPVELEFHTPKKAKKTKTTTRNPFPNDELNIMKSPVPLLRAKIAEKKRKEEEEAVKAKKKKKPNKRSASEREDPDDEDSGYGSSAVDVPASTVLPSTFGSPAISIKPAISFQSKKKNPDEIAAAASEYASRWINSGLVTRAKKNAVKAGRKPATKSPKPASLWGGGPSFFDAFVSSAAPVIPRLKSTSSVPKQ